MEASEDSKLKRLDDEYAVKVSQSTTIGKLLDVVSNLLRAVELYSVAREVEGLIDDMDMQQAELEENERTIEQLAYELDSRSEQLDAKAEDLNEREEALDDKESDLNALEVELASREADLQKDSEE